MTENLPSEPQTIAEFARAAGLWLPDYPRRLPTRRQSGHQPRAPRWSHGFQRPLGLLTADYVAIQIRPGENDEALARFQRAARAASPDAPGRREFLRVSDADGLLSIIMLGYWDDPLRHERWWRDGELGAWFRALDPAAISHGAWRETIQLGPERIETVYSDPRVAFGFAGLPGVERMPMTFNGYFGAARDRFPLSAIDPLHPAGTHERQPAAYAAPGARLRAFAGTNSVMIRSGQYWREAEGEQREDYESALEPKMLAGMDYLAHNDGVTGALSLRIATSVDGEDLRPARETSVLGHFHSLELLEEWAAGHATHHAIYEHAITENRRYGPERTVITWHEVFLLTADSGFEYVNCHPETGILPWAQRIEVQR